MYISGFPYKDNMRVYQHFCVKIGAPKNVRLIMIILKQVLSKLIAFNVE